jgi:NTP pyrophosphatase (non-canonical NTP hydrolase)
LEANEYQKLAMRTAGDGLDDLEEGMLVAALGLTGESGEFAELVKKWKYHAHPLDRDKAIKELGDICWYIARACTALNVDLADVMQTNIEKLKIRYPEGFSPHASLYRRE